jgi:CoA:oxalate CoA-transferase
MLPLSGVTILDFSRLLPGPWASQILADSGARVIKIEQPEEGDYSRGNPPFFDKESVYFHSINRNKESLCLDLKSEEGRAIVSRLIAKADVIIENFRVGVAEKLGIDYARAKQLREDIIYCSITGFGRGNPYEKVGAHDLNIQGLMGSLSFHEPSFLAADYASASYACIAILIALLNRSTHKKGCFLDIGMYDSLFTMQNMSLASELARMARFSGEPKLEVWGGNPRYAIYRTKDEKGVTISLLEKKAWELFCQEIGRSDLYDPDESAEDRHSTHGEKGEKYREAIATYCIAHTRDQIIERMHPLGIPVFPIYSPKEAVHSPLVEWRKMIQFKGGLPQIENPLSRADLTRPQPTPPPCLGQHNAEILEALGYAPSEIVDLYNKKIVFKY